MAELGCTPSDQSSVIRGLRKATFVAANRSSVCGAVTIQFGASYKTWRRIPGAPVALLNASSLVILNVGAHANSKEAYDALLDEEAMPFLTAKVGAVLWRETLPQHFGPEGYRRNLKATTVPAPFGPIKLGKRDVMCEPQAGLDWRNAMFSNRNLSVPVICAYCAFLPLYFLHLPYHDCTHYLYSPYPWGAVWAGAAQYMKTKHLG